MSRKKKAIDARRSETFTQPLLTEIKKPPEKIIPAV